MAAYSFSVEQALSSSRDDESGAVILQIGDVKSENVEDNRCAMFGQPGVMSIPAEPTAGVSACEVVALRTVDTDIVVAGRDLRGKKLSGNLKPGETAVYATSGAASELFKSNGAITMLTTEDNTDTGRAVFFQTAPAGFTWESPYGRASLDAKGYHVKDFGGARLDLGSLGMPAPLNSLSTYATLQAAMVSLRAGIVALGPDSLPKDQVALATPLVAFASALVSFCSALVTATTTAIGSCGTGGAPNAAGATAFTGSMSGPLGLVSSAGASIPTLMPSRSTASS